MATSIIGKALQSHPAWRPPVRPPASPKPPSIIGQAIQAHPNWGSPPTAPQQAPPAVAPAAPAAPPPPSMHPETTTVTPPPPDLSGNRWEGYLTPDQLGNLRQAGISYGSQVAGWQRRASDAQTAYSQQIANAQFAHDVNTQRANEEMAARGLSVSSIRANDLTDINRTLTDATASATASLNTLISDATAAIGNLQTGAGGTLGAGWASTQNMYQGDAAINAAGMAQFQPYQVTNMVPDAAPPPPPAAPAPPPAPVAINPALSNIGKDVLPVGVLTGRQGGQSKPPKSIIGKALKAHPNWKGR